LSFEKGYYPNINAKTAKSDNREIITMVDEVVDGEVRIFSGY
jgi:hypothetical protein